MDHFCMDRFPCTVLFGYKGHICPFFMDSVEHIHVWQRSPKSQHSARRVGYSNCDFHPKECRAFDGMNWEGWYHCVHVTMGEGTHSSCQNTHGSFLGEELFWTTSWGSGQIKKVGKSVEKRTPLSERHVLGAPAPSVYLEFTHDGRSDLWTQRWAGADLRTPAHTWGQRMGKSQLQPHACFIFCVYRITNYHNGSGVSIEERRRKTGGIAFIQFWG
jgi:hypothetical protein